MIFNKDFSRWLVILCGCLLAAHLDAAPNTNNLSRKELNEIWPELWKTGRTEIAPPTVDRLTRKQVINEMAGDWRIWLGEHKTVLSLATNNQFHTRGTVRGEAWEMNGDWKIIANKLVLISTDENLPVFIFRKDGTNLVFNPFVKEMMVPMERLDVPLTRPNDLAGIIIEPSFSAVGGKISEASVSNVLKTIDIGWMDGEAKVATANFADNCSVAWVEKGFHNRKNCIAFLETLFKTVDAARLYRTDLTVHISPDGRKATSKSTLKKTYLLAGRSQESTTTELASFEIINGNVSLTQLQCTRKAD